VKSKIAPKANAWPDAAITTGRRKAKRRRHRSMPICNSLARCVTAASSCSLLPITLRSKPAEKARAPTDDTTRAPAPLGRSASARSRPSLICAPRHPNKRRSIHDITQAAEQLLPPARGKQRQRCSFVNPHTTCVEVGCCETLDAAEIRPRWREIISSAVARITRCAALGSRLVCWAAHHAHHVEPERIHLPIVQRNCGDLGCLVV
jgi:hypothetical protein